MQSVVTNCLVAKPEQWHFYLPPDLRAECEAVFDAQGLKASEGLKRLVQVLLESPEPVRLLLLKQARGDAGAALARHVLERTPGGFEILSTIPRALPAAPQPAPAEAPPAEGKGERPGRRPARSR